MEKINFRFLNYKHYDTFLRDLNDNVTPERPYGAIRLDAIVFIQDKLRIWARGKEYFGDNSYIEDIAAIRERLNYLKNNIDHNDLALATVAHTGLYSDLIGTPDPITIDSQISSKSTNPVQNKAIYSKLEEKANSSDLQNYVTNDTYTTGLASKQNKLTAVSPVYIRNNQIGVEIDNELYVIVDSLLSVDPANPNKIYLVETPDGNGGVLYQQWRYKNGLWIPIGQLQADIDLSEYLKSADAEQLYQPKRNDYVVTSDLSAYTPLSRTQAIEESLNDYVNQSQLDNYQLKGDYAYREWVNETFVKKINVYTPPYGINEEHGESGGRMVTLSERRYLELVDANMIEETTYYFTYEEETNTNWTFGNTFPVILAGDGLGEFPITLT